MMVNITLATDNSYYSNHFEVIRTLEQIIEYIKGGEIEPDEPGKVVLENSAGFRYGFMKMEPNAEVTEILNSLNKS